MTLTILYVDDEPDLREIATMALELDPGIAVRTAGSGPEALSLLDGALPSLLLLDLMMPGMDGPATLAAIRDKLGAATPPVIFITARAEQAERERLLALGAAGVIAKPFDPMTLAAQIRALLGHD